jgi:NhaP-type Na+/H+ or K+/H+ antiporter
VLDQEETPLLYSLVFGEGVVNDATSIVLFNAILRFDLSHITSSSAIHLLGNFFYLFGASTALGIAVSLSPSHMLMFEWMFNVILSVFPHFCLFWG